MTNLRVSERTTTDDVMSWRLSVTTSFRVSRRSSFEPGAQGLALSQLGELSSRSIVLECEFDEPADVAEVFTSFFSMAFGFALSRLVREIRFNGRLASTGFKTLLGLAYKEKAGIFGAGNSLSIVCVDPVFPIPPAISLQADESDGFPAPSTFLMMLRSIVKTMGFQRLLTSTDEGSIVAFVYECLRNSIEHGLPTDKLRKSRSTRALTIEKLVFGPTDVADRHLSGDVKGYLARIAEVNQPRLGLGVVCFTVSDQGDGIASTLPPKENETPWSRLARAFQEGESRKPPSALRRGLGLPNVIGAAHQLQALLRISSGNLTVVQDFSFGEHRYPTLDLQGVRQSGGSATQGTSISIFVPEYRVDLDQKSLFGRAPV